MEREDKRIAIRLALIFHFAMLAVWACGAFKLCYVAYEAHGIYLGAFFALLSGLLFVYSTKCILKKACEESKKIEETEKGMSFTEFKQWWEDTCNTAPNHIVKSVECYFGYAGSAPDAPVIDSSVYFQTENLAMPEGITCREYLNTYAETEEKVVLTKSFFDDFKKQFDEQQRSMVTPRFIDAFSSIYCDVMQNGKEKLSEADKEKIRNDVIDFQKKMVADLQYISDEYDKLYERLFGEESKVQQS